MRAIVSEAFVADHRFSRRRFVGMAGVLAMLLAFFTGMMSLATNTKPDVAVGMSVMSGLVLFVALLAIAGSAWWLLWRLHWRGWASSILAGGALFALVDLVVWGVASGTGAMVAAAGASSTPMGLTVLYAALIGMAFGAIIWRYAVRPRRQEPSHEAANVEPAARARNRPAARTATVFETTYSPEECRRRISQAAAAHPADGAQYGSAFGVLRVGETLRLEGLGAKALLGFVDARMEAAADGGTRIVCRRRGAILSERLRMAGLGVACLAALALVIWTLVALANRAGLGGVGAGWIVLIVAAGVGGGGFVMARKAEAEQSAFLIETLGKAVKPPKTPPRPRAKPRPAPVARKSA